MHKQIIEDLKDTTNVVINLEGSFSSPSSLHSSDEFRNALAIAVNHISITLANVAIICNAKGTANYIEGTIKQYLSSIQNDEIDFEMSITELEIGGLSIVLSGTKEITCFDCGDPNIADQIKVVEIDYNDAHLLKYNLCESCLQNYKKKD